MFGWSAGERPGGVGSLGNSLDAGVCEGAVRGCWRRGWPFLPYNAYVGNDPIYRTDPTGLTADQIANLPIGTGSLSSSVGVASAAGGAGGGGGAQAPPVGAVAGNGQTYVNSIGTALPSTAYRYMDSQYAAQTNATMTAPLSYLGFTLYPTGTAARNGFQMSPTWSDTATSWAI